MIVTWYKFFNCKMIRLGVNIDHIATLRNARGGDYPCPIVGAKIAKKAGANGITAHLREDRRHIKDQDIIRLKNEVDLPLNFEMAATDEMVNIALRIQPNAVCLVPEKRQELTTEGGLDIIKNQQNLTRIIEQLKTTKIRISIFTDPNISQISMAKKIGADIIEIHTGKYCLLNKQEQEKEFQSIIQSVNHAHRIGLECHAGHGLNYQTAQKISQISQIVELNIGHFIIGESVFDGLENVITKMIQMINQKHSSIY